VGVEGSQTEARKNRFRKLRRVERKKQSMGRRGAEKGTRKSKKSEFKEGVKGRPGSEKCKRGDTAGGEIADQ